MVQKGKISSISESGREATVTPYAGGVVTMPLVVPASLTGLLSVNLPVLYVTFNDNTGIILGRADGSGGAGISVTTSGDAIVINTK